VFDLAALDLLSTAHLADACVRLRLPVRALPVVAVAAPARAAGRGLPARHAGSVDIFLEAIERSRPGDVLVVDNGGRTDESCVGDLVVHEAALAGLAGVVIWGLHRDTADIREIGLPVFSLGALPAGPPRARDRSMDALSVARIGDATVGQDDLVVADEDGALFLPSDRLAEIVSVAAGIRGSERRQADQLRAGRSLRDQLGFADFLAERDRNPGWTFRDHLRAGQGAIEE